MITEIIFGSLGLGGLAYGIYKGYTIHKLNLTVDQENQKFLEIQSELLKKKNSLNEEINQLNSEIKIKNLEVSNKTKELANLASMQKQAIQDAQDVSNQAMKEYQKTLNNRYNEIEIEFDSNVKLMKESYAQLQEDLMRTAAEESAKLDKIRATRTAAQEALLREKEIKEQKDFYCLSIADTHIRDIQYLNSIKPQLSNPRILCMLIWQSYFQKPLKALAAQVLGTNATVCGIYKITNINTDECYIGQSVDIAKRWAEHAKCGLGIDTPIKNKLYIAMQKEGLWNFSWELLEQCPKEQLDEKEKAYIEMYMAYDFGYNSNAGVRR